MIFSTFDRLEAPHGEAALRIYREAFPSRKPDAVIRAMFERRLSYLHTESTETEVAAMAMTGNIPQGNALLIDYLAVAEAKRERGIGSRFVRNIADWARSEKRFQAIILEAEAEPGPENEARIRFWQRCGFVLTDYVHKYIWVPETYRAMYLPLVADWRVSDRGETLFRWIGEFHRRSFAR
ncbi:GNAT family N-acetyltransferase [Cohnella algarum]|uniref:GNAT family N-acetyltransferase n=1 Tax=Cohnella algarum TaxID=2044859 RepID=UPI0019675F87|nr:GNAT family N-acetyltransferase [Cohnella algarum]MBN2983675.1 GNAT family N-acetyltransferase [Cohnella algarum]